jgi:hypothetical protein
MSKSFKKIWSVGVYTCVGEPMNEVKSFEHKMYIGGFNNTRKGCRLFNFWSIKIMILKDAIVDKSMHGL